MGEQLVTVTGEQGVTVILHHHCLWYGRWRANFGCSGHTFECWWVIVVFDEIAIHQNGQIIIYHHSIWYGRWRANFGCSGHTFGGWWVIVVLDDVSIHQYGRIIILSSVYLVWEMTSQFWGLWSHFLTVKGNCCFWWCCYTSVWSDHHTMVYNKNPPILILSLQISFRVVTNKYVSIKIKKCITSETQVVFLCIHFMWLSSDYHVAYAKGSYALKWLCMIFMKIVIGILCCSKIHSFWHIQCGVCRW